MEHNANVGSGAAYAQAETRWDRARRLFSDPTRVGAEVLVARGRKIPIGTRGCVSWAGFDKYTRRAGSPDRIGIRLGDGTVVYTSARNCEAVLQEHELDELHDLALDVLAQQRGETCSDCGAIFDPRVLRKPGTTCLACRMDAGLASAAS